MYQGQRPRLPIPFGYGLDRLTGVTEVDPRSMVDLRNVTLARGRIGYRQGLTPGLDIGWGTDVIGIGSVRAFGLAAVVVFDASSRDVRLYLSDGIVATNVGTLWTINAAATLHVPRVTMADCYSYVFIAHDEPNLTYRGATKYLQVADTTIHTLQADLDRTGTNDVFFRGVRAHLAYLIGWGFGTNADPAEGDTLRISVAGNPLDFVPEHYFRVGALGDPIIGVGPVGSDDPSSAALAVLKSADSWKLLGYDRTTFSVVPMDQNYGIISANCSATVNGEIFVWTQNGPKSSTGGAFHDLASPLDLGNPYPVDASIAAPSIDACAWFDRDEQEIVFCFSQSQYGFAYVLHLRDAPRRWSFRQYQCPVRCAGFIYTGQGAGTIAGLISATIGTPTPHAPSYGAGDDNPTFTVPWTLSGAGSGGESVEVWTKSTYDATWVKRTTVAASALTATITVPHYLTTHTIAVRVTLGSTPGAGYTGSPDTWPSAARTTSTTGGAITTFALVGLPRWARVSGTQQGLGLNYVGPGASGASHPELTFHYDQSSNAGSTWANHDGGDHAAPIAASVHGNGDSLTTFRYRLKVTGPNANTGFTSTADAVMAPDDPTITSATTFAADPTHVLLTLSVTNGANGGPQRATITNLTTGGGPWFVNLNGDTQSTVIAASSGDSVEIDVVTSQPPDVSIPAVTSLTVP